MDFTTSFDDVGISFVEFPAENTFALGTAANHANDRLIYDQGSANIYYDADGNGAGAAVLFAINVIKSPMFFYDFT